MHPQFTADFVERFWRYVDRGGGPEACWPWLRSHNRFGQGQVVFRYKHLITSRVAWEISNGTIPDGMCVCHRCDNALCCNPAHLFIGSMADNTADMVAKGRSANGSRHPGAKLIEGDVQEIREWCARGASTGSLGAVYNVSKSHIGAICRREKWKHL